MKTIYPAPLYQLLSLTQNLDEKTVLDCGAGGRTPPLALFYEYGFKTNGIDISKNQIEASREYEKKHGIDLNIIEGNMLDIEFQDASFSCVYSYNSSIHLSKKNTRQAVDEMLRVLKPGGIMYINYIWEPAKPMYLGEEKAPGECWMIGRDGELVLHTLFSEVETDELMKDTEILLKNKQQLTMKYGQGLLDDAYIHYYIRKNRIIKSI